MAEATSPSNTFMGLMNHLQTMELQLTSVLMEATMKIATMIDANVFIMVESSGQRYFSGKKYLCDSYLNNCLGPSSNDVELEIYPEVCALQEKSQHGGGGGGGGGSNFTPGSDGAPGTPRTPHTPHAPHHPSSYPPSNNASHHHPHHPPHHHQHHQQHPTPRRVRKRSSPLASTSFSVVSPKKLRTEIAASLKLEADGGEGDDVTVIDDDGEEQENFEGGFQVEAADIPTNEHMSVLSAILAHPKLEAVQQVCDSSIADKDSVASKLLNSLLYEYAKIAAHHCPYDTIDDPRCKAFYSRCFEELWTHLPNLQELHDKGLMRGGRRLSIKSSSREVMRKSFWSIMNLQKRRN